MSRCTIYIGNLDERVSDRVLYDILIQAGRVLELHMPKDRETDRPKGFAFAEYESEEIADYAIKLFSGLVTLYNRTLKFAIAARDRPSPHSSTGNVSDLNSKPRNRVVSSNDVLPPLQGVTQNLDGNVSKFDSSSGSRSWR